MMNETTTPTTAQMSKRDMSPPLNPTGVVLVTCGSIQERESSILEVQPDSCRTLVVDNDETTNDNGKSNTNNHDEASSSKLPYIPINNKKQNLFMAKEMPSLSIMKGWAGGESYFGAVDSEDEEDDNKQQQQQQAQEMIDRPEQSANLAGAAKGRSNPNNPTSGGGDDVDICRSYGYMYEYTKEEDVASDDDDDDDDDGTEDGYNNNNVYQHRNNEQTGVHVALPEIVTALLPNLDAAAHTQEDEDFTVYLLGKSYHPILDYTTRRADEMSLFWWTYRHDFPEIVPYRITSDAGWGCMLRSAQMLLAQTLRVHYRGRDWSLPQSITKRATDSFYRTILTWFADFPSQTECRYSLHNMVAAGMSRYETLPGEWYGPGTACYVIRDLCQIHEQHESQKSEPLSAETFSENKEGGSDKDDSRQMFRVYVASQGSVYRDAVEDLMTKDIRKKAQALSSLSSQTKNETATTINVAEDPLSHPLDPRFMEQEEKAPEPEWDTSCLLLIPLRLGLNSFNEAYTPALAHVFSFRQSVGVLGGRPRSARWFYGAASNGKKWYGLDPHTVQNSPRRRKDKRGRVSVSMDEGYVRSVHCASPATILLHRSDPSLALGFYCRDRSDFEHLCQSLKQWQNTHIDKQSMPDLFSIADAVPDYSANVSSVMNEMMQSNLSLGDGGFDGGEDSFAVGIDDDAQDDGSDEDEYVML